MPDRHRPIYKRQGICTRIYTFFFAGARDWRLCFVVWRASSRREQSTTWFGGFSGWWSLNIFTQIRFAQCAHTLKHPQSNHIYLASQVIRGSTNSCRSVCASSSGCAAVWGHRICTIYIYCPSRTNPTGIAHTLHTKHTHTPHHVIWLRAWPRRSSRRVSSAQSAPHPQQKITTCAHKRDPRWSLWYVCVCVCECVC